MPQFPGQPASSTNTDNSKGFVVGDTWDVSSNLINNLHYGFTRQGYASRGIGQGQYANFYNISPLYAETRTTLVDIPVHNIIDDVTLTRRAHTIQFGANYRLIFDHRRSDAFSYSYGYTNAYALAEAGIANTGQSFDPAAFGYPSGRRQLRGLLQLCHGQSCRPSGSGDNAIQLPDRSRREHGESAA